METPSPIRLLVVDDHPVLRAGLANLLGQEPDIVVVGEADCGEMAITMWRTCRPHVGLIDLRMEGVDGVETIRRIRGHTPQARLVMLTSSDASTDAELALSAGAAAYVSKTVETEQIAATIRAVHAGSEGIRRGVRELAETATPGILSPREMQVLGYLRTGSTNAEIARALGIAERTVKWHVKAVLTKLHASDRAGAVARGFDLGLLRATGGAK